MALYQRDNTGRATDVAASLLGAGVLTNSETYLRADATLADVPMLDADQTMVSAGERIVELADGWIAVAARTSDEIAAVGALVAVAAAHSVADAMAELERSGVPAAEVRRGQKGPFFDDPAHGAAGLVATYHHGEWGKLEQPGAMWFFGDQQVKLDLAPPLLGEHTVEVLSEVGMSPAAIDELIAAGAAVAR
jgi:crotonobetainyl-CoA:carnitine CoA-transferase CaiB-like acyl-CoA transferase